ncbi:MAG: hypothetical protein IJK81_06125 [Selenomonadaceae bacterium]|nr:hypothetical protein [Selenomonadaceae bacterium]
MIKELKEKICSVLNDWFFDQDKMAEIILKELYEHIKLEELGESEVTFEFVEALEPDEIMYIESEEKGVTDDGEILALTIADNPDIFKIVFVLDAMKRFISCVNPFEARDRIKGIAKHEAFHVRQYNYMIKNGGMDAIGRLALYSKQNHYVDNLLEEGAVRYQYFDEQQDFSVFDRFIEPKTLAANKKNSPR